MKRLATALLVVAGVVYVIAWRFEVAGAPGWVGYLRAAAEASLVGGLADWFAVTALFRHPMGIPIPHTAIVAARKDRIGRSLGSFVQNNFLSHDVVARKLAEVHAAERVADWLSDPVNARRITQQGARGVAPVLGRVLAVVAEDGQHQALLDAALRIVADAVEDNRDQIRERIKVESPWWVPGMIDDVIYKKLVSGIEQTLAEVRHDPLHPLRARFDAAFQRFVENLQNGTGASRRPEDAPDSPLERGIVAFGEALRNNPAIMEELDRAVTDAVLAVVEQYRGEVGDLIANTVRHWDPTATSDRIELAVGRDLQFIRINGTLVGGLAGLIIHALSVGL
jgi:uncharacterized membrane-anchored protein YjiN (DUF445 family)